MAATFKAPEPCCDNCGLMRRRTEEQHFGAATNVLRCRALPPVMNEHERAKWPKVKPSDWCGLHQPDALTRAAERAFLDSQEA